MIGEDEIRLAGLNARSEEFDPEAAGGDASGCGSVAGASECPEFVLFHGAHEGVGDSDAVVEVRRFAVRIAACGTAHLNEFLDFGMIDGEVDGGGSASEGALTDGECEGVHHADEGYDSGGFAVEPDFFAERAEVSPVGADAAAARGEPDIFVPESDDAFEGVVGFVEEARDGQSAIGAAV